MPLYDYACSECDHVIEVFHKMDERIRMVCTECRVPFQKLLSTGMCKRPDASWVQDINGVVNELDAARSGKQEYISTREQARAKIKALYADPYPKARNKEEVAANKRVGALRQRYLERY